MILILGARIGILLKSLISCRIQLFKFCCTHVDHVYNKHDNTKKKIKAI